MRVSLTIFALLTLIFAYGQHNQDSIQKANLLEFERLEKELKM